MYYKKRPGQTTIRVNKALTGETIEKKIRRIVENKEPIKDGAPLVYTERKDGVIPEYDIRTDRFEIAIDAMDKASKSYRAKREEKQSLGEQAIEGMKKENDGKAESIQAT